MTGSAKDRWASSDLYDAYVGRWSRLVAREFLAWLDAPPGLHWLDVGCGTGALLEAIAESCSPQLLAGLDPSAGFLASARQRLGSLGADLQEADARDLPFGAAAFDIVVSGLVLNFVPDHSTAATEMVRVTRPGGQVALYVWDYAGKMEFMREFWEAAAALDPFAAGLDEGKRSAICQPEPLRDLFEATGLIDVATRAIDVPTIFRDFDDYWAIFLGGQGPAAGYCASLSGDTRAALRERIRASLPTRPDRSIHLTARAWAVRGRKA